MSIVLLLIPLAFVLVALAVAALFWAVDSGQYDNLEEAARALWKPTLQTTTPMCLFR